MNSSDGKLRPKDQLVAIFRQLQQRRESGTLFITSEQGNRITIVFELGSVTAMQHRRDTGSDVIPILNELQFASYRFDPNIQMLKAQANIPAKFTLGQFAESAQTSRQSDDQAEQSIKPASSDELNEWHKQIIKEELTRYVGPLASMACERVFSRVYTLQQALQMLKAQMPDPKQAKAFIDSVSERLGHKS